MFMPIVKLLKCAKCGTSKPETEFYRNNRLANAPKQRKRAAPRERKWESQVKYPELYGSVPSNC